MNRTPEYMLFNKKFLLPYLFCLAIIIGPAYNMYVHYDFSHSIDTESYLSLSNGDIHVKAIHRYRLIIPALAKVLSLPLESIYTSLWPHRSESLWPLQLAYFILNTFLTALFGFVVYELTKRYTKHTIAILIALVAILTSRWVAYIAGLPLTDSLYLLAIAGLLYSIKTTNKRLFICIVLLGPLSKESFLLFAPFVLLAGPFKWPHRLFLVVFSFFILLSEHAIIDHFVDAAVLAERNMQNETLSEIMIRHIGDVTDTLQKLSGIRGLGELCTVLGIFSVILLYGSLSKGIRTYWSIHIEKTYWIFFLCIIVHALLSGDAARMLYFGAPLYALMIALCIEKTIPLLSKKEG